VSFSLFLSSPLLSSLSDFTQVPVGDQPKDIETQIRNMCLKYINKKNAIVLAVTAANTDLANSDGLNLARQVDPEGWLCCLLELSSLSLDWTNFFLTVSLYFLGE